MRTLDGRSRPPSKLEERYEKVHFKVLLFEIVGKITLMPPMMCFYTSQLNKTKFRVVSLIIEKIINKTCSNCWFLYT